jgi:hypothetical protein
MVSISHEATESFLIEAAGGGGVFYFELLVLRQGQKSNCKGVGIC